MTNFSNFNHPYDIHPKYQKKVAYFSMEYGIDQALKTFSGGLGFLAGSHMRSAYEQRQNLIGIGVLWKYGYYDQVRKTNRTMDILHLERFYNFLQDTNLTFEINIHRHPIKVKAYYLAPEVFGTVPMFFLSTDLPENDYLARTISHQLYDPNTEARIAQYTLLGIGGAKLLDLINYDTEVYHFNEAHALPAAFYLYDSCRDLAAVREKVVFTTHTPDPGGNEIHDINLLHRMSFFNDLPLEEVRRITGVTGGTFNTTLVGLRMARIANGVSKMHGEVSRKMWAGSDNICEITHITNSQNKKYWADKTLQQALERGDDAALWQRKLELKQHLFKNIADQSGKVFDPNVLTVVWARRFAAYKRANLLLQDLERFEKIISNAERPIQLIWAGKPYPKDYTAINIFNELIQFAKKYPNVTILTGYELGLSKMMKDGSDVWLNTPRITREASGTSGMTAAMNGSVNFSTPDGWIPEFAVHGHNAFVLPALDASMPHPEQDATDLANLFDMLEGEILPTYYDDPKRWLNIVKNAMNEITPYFDSNRMVHEYYDKLYQFQPVTV